MLNNRDLLIKEIEAISGLVPDLSDEQTIMFVEAALIAMDKYADQEIKEYINTIHICKN